MKPTILCIEDHPDNMMLIRRIFRPDSYNLIEARTGVQGLSIAEGQNLDLILLDINLPDIDGYEIARRVRSSAKTALAQMPIIAVTANALKGDSKKAMDAGCDVYMSKPINIFELLETVEALVGKKTQGTTL
ncbi:MAG TPA: response regulator [Anaerolineales bacterium]|nr:response regulator [Anaerolineales bacterium]